MTTEWGCRQMWQKKDRLAGGRLPGCKERGEWAELYFMMMAAGQGMKVSKPFGDSASYDVGAENSGPNRDGRVLRVQVKSTLFKRRGECYSLNVMTQRKKYRPGTVDFFAILLIPVDDWYIIPFEVVGRTNSTLHFSPESKRGKYRGYREAWDLLWGDGLTIQACCDPVALGWGRVERGLGFLDFEGSSDDADGLARLEMTESSNEPANSCSSSRRG
jgi:hypothetical protein